MNKKTVIFNSLILGFCLSFFAFSMGSRVAPPQTVESVDLLAYEGRWFEVARIPNNFQDNRGGGKGVCFDTTAEYEILSGPRVGVLNSCFLYDGDRFVKQELARAVGRPVERSRNSKLRVNFTGSSILRAFGIGDGDYWILGLGPLNSKGEYSWALVGSPDRRFGWILARQARLDFEVKDEILDLAESLGYSRTSFRKFTR